MLSDLKTSFKHTIFYAIGNLAPKLSGFILLPIYTKLISVADYGILGLFELVEVLSANILVCGMPQVLLRWYGLTSEIEKKKKYIFTILLFLICVCGASFLLVSLGKNFLSRLLLNNTEYGDYFLILFTTIILSVLSRVPLTILRSEEMSYQYAICVFLQFTTNLIANIYFVAILKLGVKGILISQALSSTFIFLILSPYLLSRINIKVDLPELKEMVAFGYPFIFSGTALTILSLGDRYLLAQLATFDEVGLYTLGYKFSNLIKVLLVDAFILGLPAIGWKIVKENKHPQHFFSKTLTYYVFALLWCGLIASAYGKGIIHRFAVNQAYWDAYQVMPYLVLSIVFLGMQFVFFFQLQIPRKTKTIPLITGGSALLNILLNIILIPKLGIMGAAYATVLSQLTSLIFAYRTVQKFYPINYEFNRIFMLFISSIILFLLTTLFNNYSLGERIFYKGMIILSFPVVLYFLNFYTEFEIAKIRGSIKNWSRNFLS